jgi:hypothetical protein
MKKKTFIFAVAIILLVGLTVLAQNVLFVKINNTDLKASPTGESITSLKQGTKMEVVETSGNWVKVKVVGWIRKDAATNDKSEIGKSERANQQDGTEISGGFIYDNVNLKTSYGTTEVIGEMTNNSERNYQIANFIISLYDESGSLLGTGYINISNFSNGQTKTFRGMLSGTYPNASKYRIQFENGF